MLKLLNCFDRVFTGLVGVMGIITLTAIPAVSQQLPTQPVNQIKPSRSINQNGKLVGGNGNVRHPSGARINSDGSVSTPTGDRTSPSVTIKHGDGSASYYYRDGSRITVEPPNVPSTGKLIR